MVINRIVGVYAPIIRIPIKGGMTIPNIATFDHGTYACLFDLTMGRHGARCIIATYWYQSNKVLTGRL